MNELYNFFSRERTDHQYNPTLWTRRLPTDKLLPAHSEYTAKKSEEYRSQTKKQTLIFGKSEYKGEMDVFRPKNVPDNAPIVVYVHGGWWQWFSKEQFSFLAEPFNRNDFAVYMPAYRMAQDWHNEKPMESILIQMEYAMAAVLQEACDKNAPAVHLIGHSAGGHLAAMLQKSDWSKYDLPAESRKKLKSIFSIAGLFDIRFLLNSYINDAIKMSYESAAAVSPQLQPAFDEPFPCPLHLILPEFDTAEFFRQTKEYQEKLLQEGRDCRLHVVHNRDHLDIIEKLIHDNDELLHYLLEHMKQQ